MYSLLVLMVYSLKQEKIYRIELDTVREAKQAVEEYMDFYNNRRPHQSLDYQVPREIHFKENQPIEMMDKSNDLPTVQQAQQQHNLTLTKENYISN